MSCTGGKNVRSPRLKAALFVSIALNLLLVCMYAMSIERGCNLVGGPEFQMGVMRFFMADLRLWRAFAIVAISALTVVDLVVWLLPGIALSAICMVAVHFRREIRLYTSPARVCGFCRSVADAFASTFIEANNQNKT